MEKRKTEDIIKVFDKLSHPKRLEIVLNLLESKCCVKEMTDKIKLPQASLSQHLKLLRESNILTTQRMGKKVVYCLEDEWLRDILKYIKEKIEI
ncbi:MAG TPA: metalloregulator ArsR/SmtB family transcription factor [Spirochaetota bacterium]|nr:metalloregulator ArsR/SmtB family transcription factor [Spirochaetota bacterium]HOM38530.1 metalloregulator ArsR/SmtB family transcription factor [Spirochaetota bacterium]HPQ49070.1 metalloregulator ArsR/SmtB family transcription factor [Spirochaetota bacterium]